MYQSKCACQYSDDILLNILNKLLKLCLDHCDDIYNRSTADHISSYRRGSRAAYHGFIGPCEISRKFNSEKCFVMSLGYLFQLQIWIFGIFTNVELS